MPQIRAYTEADREPVVSLALRAWEPGHASMRRVLGDTIYQRLIPDWREHQRRTVTEDLDSERSHVWVAVHEGSVAGFVAVHLKPEDSAGHIYLVAVDPDHQNAGVGRALVGHATEWIRAQGMETAMIETGGEEGHAAARSVYEAAGYTPLPVVRYFRAL